MPQLTESRGAARPLHPTEGPALNFDLAAEIQQLRQEPYWQSGHNSKTIVHYPDLRVVVTAIRANTTIHEHKSSGRVAVQTLQGHLRMHAAGKEVDLPTGGFLVVDKTVPYDLQAIEDSALLLTVAWPDDDCL